MVIVKTHMFLGYEEIDDENLILILDAANRLECEKQNILSVNMYLIG